jgi:hypothetical protein
MGSRVITTLNKQNNKWARQTRSGNETTFLFRASPALRKRGPLPRYSPSAHEAESLETAGTAKLVNLNGKARMRARNCTQGVSNSHSLNPIGCIPPRANRQTKSRKRHVCAREYNSRTDSAHARCHRLPVCGCAKRRREKITRKVGPRESAVEDERTCSAA